jgi:Holliday junction resolvase RusA-like endonuclease
MWLTIMGQPITKKNSQQIIMAGKRPCIIQSKAYRKYEKTAKQQIALLGAREPISGPVAVKCLYYLATARTPDLSNLMAATHDILEGCGVILNDEQIKSVDGTRIIGKDPNPRVEIEIVDFDALDLPVKGLF